MVRGKKIWANGFEPSVLITCKSRVAQGDRELVSFVRHYTVFRNCISVGGPGITVPTGNSEFCFPLRLGEHCGSRGNLRSLPGGGCLFVSAQFQTIGILGNFNCLALKWDTVFSEKVVFDV